MFKYVAFSSKIIPMFVPPWSIVLILQCIACVDMLITKNKVQLLKLCLSTFYILNTISPGSHAMQSTTRRYFPPSWSVSRRHQQAVALSCELYDCWLYRRVREVCDWSNKVKKLKELVINVVVLLGSYGWHSFYVFLWGLLILKRIVWFRLLKNCR